MFVVLSLLFGGMGGVFISLALGSADFSRDDLLPIMLTVLAGAAMLCVPLLLGKRAIGTIVAYRQKKRGALRQGIFAGPAGLLVRLEPFRCFAITWDQFIQARLFPPAESVDTRRQTFIFETRAGNVEFFADRLDGVPEDLHRAAKEHCPAWKRPKSVVRNDRQRRNDPASLRRFNHAAAWFVAGMILVGIALALTILQGESTGSAVLLLLGFGVLAGGVGKAGSMFFRLKVRYRCPGCRQRLRRLDEALPEIHYYCPACNTEWITGLEEREADGD